MKIILLITVFCVRLGLNAQIEIDDTKPKYVTIGIAKRMGEKIAELSYYLQGTDTVYYLMYKNERYTRLIDYQGVRFEGGSAELSQLYDLMIKVLRNENAKYELDIVLGKTKLTLKKEGNFGSYIWFWTTDGYVSLREKDINNLFNRSSK